MMCKHTCQGWKLGRIPKEPNRLVGLKFWKPGLRLTKTEGPFTFTLTKFEQSEIVYGSYQFIVIHTQFHISYA